MPETVVSDSFETGAIKAISRSEMTALISDSLIRRGAELARRRVEIARAEWTANECVAQIAYVNHEHKIYAK